MFSFLRRSAMHSPSGRMRQALQQAGLPAGTDADALGVVERRGSYSGRKVTFFRVFDPRQAAARGINVFSGFSYNDLTAHMDLMLWAGHIEPDGTIVVNNQPDGAQAGQPPPADPGVPGRVAANRADHADDERFVSGAQNR